MEWGRGATKAATAGVMALAVAVWLVARRPPQKVLAAPVSTAVSTPARAPEVGTKAASGSVQPARVEVQAPRAERRRTARTEMELARYLASARYPPSCRPMRERPELAEPNRVAAQTLPLSSRGQPSKRARVTLRQDRYFTTSGDVVTFGLGCSIDGEPARCEVRSARAEPAPDMPLDGAPSGPRAVAFVAGEGGGVEARFDPSKEGFDSYHGPIRVTAALRVGDEEGEATFDVEHTPSPPAVFTGAVREALVDGAIEVHVGLEVTRGGRYVVIARVDDARGRRFAYLRETATLEPGAREVRLQIFGKLVADEGAVAPFRVRDLEGLRLVERYPDKETMRPREGAVIVTRPYAMSDFSTAEWESEEKERRVRLLERDLL